MKKLLIFIYITIVCFNASAQKTLITLPLWETGAPGFENRKNEPEKSQDWWVKNIHNPSITIFRPKNPNGSAVLICPGGGHRELVFDEEGTKTAKFLSSLGMTAVVLKYRLYREEGSPYTADHPRQDVTRAMQLIRSNASKWNVDTNRIGVMGFSAGGEVVNMIAYSNNPGNPNAKDKIAKQDANPNFNIQIYPGPSGIPEKVSKDAIPVFLLASNNDKCCSASIFKLLNAYREAGAESEAHFYAKAGHGFNMGDRSEFATIKGWPQRLADWLNDYNFFKKEDK